MKFSEFFTKESALPARGIRILWRKSARAQQGESVELFIIIAITGGVGLSP
jgi:hypothetical protein